MPTVARRIWRDPRLVVLPVIGLFLGLMAGLFLSDAATVAEVAVAAPAPVRPPPIVASESPAPRRPKPPEPIGKPVRIEIPSIGVKAKIVPRFAAAAD